MLTINGTSVVKIVPRIGGVNWGVLALLWGLWWNDHTYQSDGISVCLLVSLGEVEWVKALGWHGVMFAVTLDEVMMCLVGPHLIYGSWYFLMFLLRDVSLT